MPEKNAIVNAKGNWLLGLFKEFVTDTLGTLKLVGNMGGVVRFRLLYGINYMVNDPAVIQGVLLDQSDKFIKNRGFWKRQYDIFGQGLITAEGAVWKQHRKMVAPAFQPKKISTYIQHMVHYADELIAQWSANGIRDIHDDMMLVTAQVVTRSLFNSDFNEEGNTLREVIKEIENQFAIRAKRPFFFMDKVPTPTNRKFFAALAELEKQLSKYIERHRTKTGSDGTLLSMLMAARDENGQPLNDKELRDECVTLILAGHDSTAITLSWAFYLLSQHPEYWAKIRREWDEILPDRNPTFDDLFKLPLTRGVIKETLRLYPPAYIFGRETLETTEINGYTFPKGKAVVISPYVLGRNPNYYPEPETFRPERWTPEFEKSLPKFAFLPFGGGPRVCVGEGFAQSEAMTLMIVIGRRFTLEYAGDTAPVPLTSITMPPKHGMPMRCVPA